MFDCIAYMNFETEGEINIAMSLMSFVTHGQIGGGRLTLQFGRNIIQRECRLGRGRCCSPH